MKCLPFGCKLLLTSLLVCQVDGGRKDNGLGIVVALQQGSGVVRDNLSLQCHACSNVRDETCSKTSNHVYYLARSSLCHNQIVAACRDLPQDIGLVLAQDSVARESSSLCGALPAGSHGGSQLAG